MSVDRRTPSLLASFNYAFEGVIHVLRTQRNMRSHFMIAVGVLVAAVVTGVQRFELIALLLSIAFVLIAEMINTAVEAAIDVATTSFDPLAKLAKDVAAGAVLIATVNAVAIGYLVFQGEFADRNRAREVVGRQDDREGHQHEHGAAGRVGGLGEGADRQGHQHQRHQEGPARHPLPRHDQDQAGEHGRRRDHRAHRGVVDAGALLGCWVCWG